jgi:hypothetical protein
VADHLDLEALLRRQLGEAAVGREAGDDEDEEEQDGERGGAADDLVQAALLRVIRVGQGLAPPLAPADHGPDQGKQDGRVDERADDEEEPEQGLPARRPRPSGGERRLEG